MPAVSRDCWSHGIAKGAGQRLRDNMHTDQDAQSRVKAQSEGERGKDAPCGGRSRGACSAATAISQGAPTQLTGVDWQGVQGQ